MNKRTLVALVCLIFCFMTLHAVSRVVPVSGNGYFGSELSVYASGDTIMFVYFNTEDAEDFTDSFAKFRISSNAGADWQEYTIPQALTRWTRPTLSVLSDGIYVSVDKYRYKSTDGGQNWTLVHELPAVWESTPYVFEHVAGLMQYEVNLPYPEWIQNDYVIEDNPHDILKPYSYYVDEDISMNNNNVYWDGRHVISGVFRANSDIKIRNAGGGNNGGWPTFMGEVITAGDVLSMPANYPVDVVFQGGLTENQPMADMPWHNPARENGIEVREHGTNIYLIEVNGSTYTGWHGEVSVPRPAVYPVYSEYPPTDESVVLFENQVMISDTTWTPIPQGNCEGQTFFFDGELWIKGTFSGKQTWTSSGKLKILDDILLTNTPAGQNPHDNILDQVNLVSEKSIEIKYGYKDPGTNERVHCFMGAHSEPHYIYAHLYALGSGNREGIFTFEYQHPHPSTPAVELEVGGETVLYENIDLHRYQYPPSTASPWPVRLDLPWYNPLWPEAHPYLERGSIVVHGNIYQRKRGYTHRSLHDTEYPSNSGVWDIENDLCGGPSGTYTVEDPSIPGLVLSAQNYPEAQGSGIGYYVTILGDERLQFFADHDSWYRKFWDHGIRIVSATPDDLIFPVTGRFSDTLKSKCFDSRDGQFLMGANDALVISDNDALAYDLSSVTWSCGTILSARLDQNLHPIVLQSENMPDGSVMATIKAINPNNGDPQATILLTDTGFYSTLQGFCVMPDGQKIFGKYTDGQILLYTVRNGSLGAPFWQVAFDAANLQGSKLSLIPSSATGLELFIWKSSSPDTNTWGTISHHHIQTPVSNSDPTTPELDRASISAYPNPARSSMNISMKIMNNQRHEVEVFNIRGQKIRSFENASKNANDQYSIDWDLKDQSQNPVAKGVYILRLKVDGKAVDSKRVSVY